MEDLIRAAPAVPGTAVVAPRPGAFAAAAEVQAVPPQVPLRAG